MKKLIILILLPFMCFASDIKVSVTLNPTGSFEITSSRIIGSAKREGQNLKADKIMVNVNSFKTGLDLRDEHTKEKLQYKKFPSIKITNAKAANGKGSAEIEIMSIKKPITFTYTDKGSSIVAKFPLNLKEFKIGGINYMGIGVGDTVQVVANLDVK